MQVTFMWNAYSQVRFIPKWLYLFIFEIYKKKDTLTVGGKDKKYFFGNAIVYLSVTS